MKRLALALFSALITGLFLATGTAEAQATRIEFTGTMTCTETSPGVFTFPDGNFHIRGVTSVCNVTTTLPIGSTVDYPVGNYNLDATGSGTGWGTSQSTSNGAVVSVGTFTAKVTGLGSPGATLTLRGLTHGQGPLEGSTIFVRAECQVTMGVTACDLSGYMLVP